MITIEINDTDITGALARAVAALTDTAPLMADIAEYLRTSTVKRFGDGIAPDGSPWAANSPVTLARKTDPRPLFGPNNRLNREFGVDSGADFAEVSSVLPYAAMMQFGGAKARFPHLWGNIPARPFFGIAEEDRSNILDIVAEYLEAVLQP